MQLYVSLFIHNLSHVIICESIFLDMCRLQPSFNSLIFCYFIDAGTKVYGRTPGHCSEHPGIKNSAKAPPAGSFRKSYWQRQTGR